MKQKRDARCGLRVAGGVRLRQGYSVIRPVAKRQAKMLLLSFVLCLLISVHVFGDNVNVTDHQLKTTKPVPVVVVPPASGSPTPAAPVKIADGDDAALGAKANSVATTDTGTFSLIALFKRALQTLTTGNTSTTAIATNTTLPTLTRFRDTALTSTAVAVKASAGNVHGWNFINLNTVPVYVKCYNIAAGSVTVGTSAVSVTIAIPASGAFFVRSELVPQQTFSTAISIAAVTGIADNSTAAPATAIHASVQYQ